MGGTGDPTPGMRSHGEGGGVICLGSGDWRRTHGKDGDKGGNGGNTAVL